MLKTVIIDDEELSLDALRKSLELFCPDVKIIGEASSADAGKVLIETLKPQLIFLDIAMPVKNGFELLKVS